MARAPRIPSGDDFAAAAPADHVELPRDARAERMGLPDFRSMSADGAARYFADHPEAPRRNVLTAEGWYVHPVAPGADRLSGR